MKLTVVRTKTYIVEVEADSVWSAQKRAESVDGRAWQLVDDSIVGVRGLDGVVRTMSQPCKHNPEPEDEADIPSIRIAEAANGQR